MVEFIKKGELPGEKVFNGTCPNCKSVVRFKAKEAKEYGTDKLKLPCPLEGCHSDITVEKYPNYGGWGGYR